MSKPILLKGMYATGPSIPYEAYQINDDLFTIQFINGTRSPIIGQIFPGAGGVGINVNKTDFENFKNNVVNNPQEPWIVTIGSRLFEIPGTWTTETSGGKKRKSQKKRKSHKRGHKKSRRH